MNRLLKTSILSAALGILILAGSAPAQQYTPRRGTIPNDRDFTSGESLGETPGYWGGYYNESPNRYNNLGRNNSWYYDYYGLSGSQRRMGQASMGGSQYVRGEVLRTKKIDVRGTDTQNLVALVETDSGRRTVVDLGPLSNLHNNDVHLGRGDHLSVRGFFVRIGDHRVLMARQLRFDGDNVSINRPRLPAREEFQEEEGLTRRGTRSARDHEDEDRQGRYSRGYGEEEEDQGSSRGQRSYGNEEEQGQQIRGKVLRTRDVRLPGMDDKLCLAEVKTSQGQRYIVNLGPKQDLDNLDLDKGDQLTVWGPSMRMSGHRLMLAERVRANGTTKRLRQEGESGMEAQMRRVRGQIVRTREVQLPGMEEPLLVAEVKTEQGRRYIVNLGPKEHLENIQLHQGDDISVRGRAFEMDGQHFLFAEHVRANGETADLSSNQGS